MIRQIEVVVLTIHLVNKYVLSTCFVSGSPKFWKYYSGLDKSLFT